MFDRQFNVKQRTPLMLTITQDTRERASTNPFADFCTSYNLLDDELVGLVGLGGGGAGGFPSVVGGGLGGGSSRGLGGGWRPVGMVC